MVSTYYMRFEPVETRFWSKVATGEPDECWPFTRTCNRLGYGMFHFQGKDRGAHRVAFFLAHGRWPEPQCLHSCDNPSCCNPAHLREGTHSENMRECVERGRRTTQRGEAHPQARLSERQVTAMREMRTAGAKLREIAERFGVSTGHAGKICQGAAWRT